MRAGFRLGHKDLWVHVPGGLDSCPAHPADGELEGWKPHREADQDGLGSGMWTVWV